MTMKKLLLIMAAALMLLPACTKESGVSPGVYSSWTYQGTLYLEIPENGSTCFMHFDERKETEGYFRIEGKEIYISARVSSKKGLCSFSIDEAGTITSYTTFGVPYENPDGGKGWASFTKRAK